MAAVTATAAAAMATEAALVEAVLGCGRTAQPFSRAGRWRAQRGPAVPGAHGLQTQDHEGQAVRRSRRPTALCGRRLPKKLSQILQMAEQRVIHSMGEVRVSRQVTGQHFSSYIG